MTRRSTLLSLLLCFVAALLAASPDHTEILPGPRLHGIPFYQIYEERDIEDTSRGNFITSSPDGRLFFGNETGIHTFDGTAWKLVLKTEGARTKIRSLLWTEQGLFAAGYGTLGQLVFDRDDGFRYQTFNQTPLTGEASEFFARILRQDNHLYLIGTRSVVRYDLNAKTHQSFPFDSWVKGSLLLDGALLISTDREGLLRLEGDRFVPVPGYREFVDGRTINQIAASVSGEIAFATQNDGLYYVPAGEPISSYQKIAYNEEAGVSDLAYIDGHRIALSIAGRGIFVINHHGDTLLSLEKEHDYRWSAAAQLHVDAQGALWTMFNSSIGKVLLDSPLTPIDERMRPSFVYPIAHTDRGKLYVRNQGRLYRAEHAPDGRLLRLADATPGLDASVSVALAAPDGIYVHAETRTYLLSHDGSLRFLGETGRMDRMAAFKNDPNRILGFSANRIKLLQRRGDRLEVAAEIPHNAGLINKIARAPDNLFWLEIGVGKLGKVTVEGDALAFRLYDQNDRMPEDWIAIWEHGDQVLFTERSGVFAYDAQADRLRRIDDFEPYFPNSKGPIHRVATDPRGNVWASYNHFNYILWRQPDGSYRKDSYALSQLGELYVNQFKFLENGDAILLTASEMFHVDASRFLPADQRPSLRTDLLEVSSIEGSQFHFLNTGLESSAAPLELDADQRSLSFRVANTFSATVEQPSFQHYLEGVSQDWSKWSSSNEFSFTNLDAGAYTLRVRSRIGDAASSDELVVRFRISPTFWETPAALALYALLAALALVVGYRYLARNLRSANARLETMVAQRTCEIEAKNAELESNARELSQALQELRDAQDQLVATSRKAGMAEVATNVLHNVGNVLNSINISVASLSGRLEPRRVDNLVRVSQLLNARVDSLSEFFASDPKGKALPKYLDQLSRLLRDDFEQLHMELECMQENIDHVKKVIATQQAHAKTVDLHQQVDVPQLVEAALTMILGDLDNAHFEVDRDYDEPLAIQSDKHRILQMVANFIKNAKEAIEEANHSLGVIRVSAKRDASPGFIRVQVSDNGIGIPAEHLQRIFTHGFTTKTEGHGFGMHSCANTAKLLGGRLDIASDGPGQGATVTLVLPVRPPQRAAARPPVDRELAERN